MYSQERLKILTK